MNQKEAEALLERALDAEDRCDALAARIRDLESRMLGALNAEPTTASRALSWIGRAEQAEDLISRLLLFIDQRSLSTTDFPPGWVSRAQAQMKAVAILRRDHEAFAERPEDADEYWSTYVDSLGHRDVRRDTGPV